MIVLMSLAYASSTAVRTVTGTASATVTTSALTSTVCQSSAAAQTVMAITFPTIRTIALASPGHRKMEDVRLMKGVEMEETGEMEEMEKNPSQQHRRGEEEVGH